MGNIQIALLEVPEFRSTATSDAFAMSRAKAAHAQLVDVALPRIRSRLNRAQYWLAYHERQLPWDEKRNVLREIKRREMRIAKWRREVEGLECDESDLLSDARALQREAVAASRA